MVAGESYPETSGDLIFSALVAWMMIEDT